MSFVIRSANGQRSLSKITNKDQARIAVRDEIVEALKGLTIKFELKIEDIVQSIETHDSEPSADQQTQATFANCAGDILSELKTKLVNEQQQAASQVRPEPAKEAAQPEQKSSLATTIRPVSAQPKPAPSQSLHKEAILDEPKVARAEPAEPRVNKLLLSTAPKPAKLQPGASTIVKGSLKIGTTTKTCCVWFDETKQPPLIYISSDSDRLRLITQTIADMSAKIEAQPAVNSIDVGDIVFAKSKDDDSWYRSIVERVGVEDVEVLMFDWGLVETLDMSRIKRMSVLELGLSSNPALAVKVKIGNSAGSLIDKFLECDKLFDVKVESYDDFDETYTITLLGVSSG